MLVPVLAIGTLLLLMGASGRKPRGTHGTPSEQAAAAAYCEAQGGQVEMMEDVQGVLRAICLFPDDRMVDAVDYYRGAAVPELPTCPAGLAFDPQTGACVSGDELPDVGPGPEPDPNTGPAPRPGPTPGPSPSDGATALAVCDRELSALWQPYQSPGGNLGNNWYAWLKDLFFALAAGLMPQTTGGVSFMEIAEEGAQSGDPNFLRFVGVDWTNARVLAELGTVLMTGGQTCQPWMIPEPPPLTDRALAVWFDIYAAAQEAVYEAAGFECPPGTTYSEMARECIRTLSPSGGGSDGSGGGSERICPVNWAYNALHDKCCPDGYSYDPKADTCKPTGFLGASGWGDLSDVLVLYPGNEEHSYRWRAYPRWSHHKKLVVVTDNWRGGDKHALGRTCLRSPKGTPFTVVSIYEYDTQHPYGARWVKVAEPQPGDLCVTDLWEPSNQLRNSAMSGHVMGAGTVRTVRATPHQRVAVPQGRWGTKPSKPAPRPRTSVPRSRKFILGAVKVPRGAIAVRRRDGTYEVREGFAGMGFAGMGCSSGGCRAKWTPNRGQRMGNSRGASAPRSRGTY